MSKRFRTDIKLENDGVWMDLDHVRIKITRAGENNRAFKEYMSAEHKKVETAMRVGMVSEEAAKRMLRGAYAKVIIKDWETRQDDDSFIRGVEVCRENVFSIIPPSPAAYEEYLLDEANNDTYRAIRNFSTDAVNYAEIRQVEAGN